ncbi:MAG: MarR family transcriptional regulator [Deltaproteobacteria bacterium]|nr:MarR family transcriptional regulator [Deltaproteobacteria bacterium]
MRRQESIERIMTYVNDLNDPGIDPEMVKKGLSVFYLHGELENLIEYVTIKRYGLSLRHLETLMALFYRQDSPLMPAQLAEEVGLTRPAMTSNLDSLQRKGYLSRFAHPNDRRKLVITLTQKGVKLCEKIMPIYYQDMTKTLEKIPMKMLFSLEKIYKMLMHSLNEILKEGAI